MSISTANTSPTTADRPSATADTSPATADTSPTTAETVHPTPRPALHAIGKVRVVTVVGSRRRPAGRPPLFPVRGAVLARHPGPVNDVALASNQLRARGSPRGVRPGPGRHGPPVGAGRPDGKELPLSSSPAPAEQVRAGSAPRARWARRANPRPTAAASTHPTTGTVAPGEPPAMADRPATLALRTDAATSPAARSGAGHIGPRPSRHRAPTVRLAVPPGRGIRVGTMGHASARSPNRHHACRPVYRQRGSSRLSQLSPTSDECSSKMDPYQHRRRPACTPR